MKQYTFNDFTINSDNKTIITGNQLWISLFHSSVLDTFRQMALDTINRYIAAHQDIIFDKSDDLIGVLQVNINKNIDIDEKYCILIFLYNETKGLEKELMIKKTLLPHESYFKNFKKLVIAELEKLIFS